MKISTEKHWGLVAAVIPVAWALAFVLVCLTIGSKPDLCGWKGLLLVLVPAYGAFHTSPQLTPDDDFNDKYTRFIIIAGSNLIALCFTTGSRVNITQKITQNNNHKHQSVWVRGWKNGVNSRRIRMPGENPYLWPTQKSTAVFEMNPKMLKDKPQDPPATLHNLATRGKWAAVFIRLMYLLLNGLILAFYTELRVPAIIGTLAPSDFSSEKESIIRRLLLQYLPPNASITPVTTRELQIRAFLVAERFIPDYLSLCFFNDLFAIIFIATGIDASWEWPPLFGPITQAYTMRRFWATFWHRLVYKPFNFLASAISSTLFIPRGTNFSRILNNCLVFVLSAVMHAVVSWKYGIGCAWGRGTMVNWCVQPMAFVLEGVVQYGWKLIRKNSFWWIDPLVLGAFERAVGYAWVAAWLMWSIPKKDFVLTTCEA